MRVYLSQSDPEDGSFEYFSNVSTFARGVMDSEASHIVCDRFLSSFPHDDVAAVSKLIFQKMRIGCELVIIEPDFYLISKHIFDESASINDINPIVFKSNTIKSLLTMDAVTGLVGDPNLEIVSKHFDEALCLSIVKIRRNQ
jgi:hypothetical protein|tara:strand:- start:502 stop:927 length:426 start_codon:yes stop_codon:yes gene_type:complete